MELISDQFSIYGYFQFFCHFWPVRLLQLNGYSYIEVVSVYLPPLPFTKVWEDFFLHRDDSWYIEWYVVWAHIYHLMWLRWFIQDIHHRDTIRNATVHSFSLLFSGKTLDFQDIIETAKQYVNFWYFSQYLSNSH